MVDEKRPLVLYHGPGCTDGFASAWTARRHFGDRADYVPMQYGDEPPDVTGREVWILDFSFVRPVLLEMASKARRITVLDHHQSAQQELSGLATDNLKCVFDMERSGARLTWEHFFPDVQPHWLVLYAEDRDLWAWKLWESRAVNAALASYPHDFAVWDEMGKRHHLPSLGLVNEGRAILRYQQQLVDHLCQHAREVVIDGQRVLAVNTPLLISEVAGKLAENRPFGACWFETEDGLTVWSLRSTDQGVDVSEVARRQGGGGHKRAAGFQTQGGSA